MIAKQFPFYALPMECKICVLSHVDEQTLKFLSIMNELTYIFGNKSYHRQRIWEDKSKREFGNDLLSFKKKEYNWEHFY